MGEKKIYITEIGFILAAIGGGLMAVTKGLSPSSEILPWLNGIGAFMTTTGASLLAFRVSKKLKK